MIHQENPVIEPATISGDWIKHSDLAAQLGLSPEGLRKRRVKNLLPYEWKKSSKTFVYRFCPQKLASDIEGC